MKNQNGNERTLAYKSAVFVDTKELEYIGGGACVSGTTSYTTKQTANQYGGDVGVDMIWD